MRDAKIRWPDSLQKSLNPLCFSYAIRLLSEKIKNAKRKSFGTLPYPHIWLILCSPLLPRRRNAHSGLAWSECTRYEGRCGTCDRCCAWTDTDSFTQEANRRIVPLGVGNAGARCLHGTVFIKSGSCRRAAFQKALRLWYANQTGGGIKYGF